MRTRFSVALLLLATALLAGCASSTMSRIDRDRPKYESWPLDVQEAVLAGEARKGMTPEQVEMALGKPTEVVYRGARGEDEVWIYRKGSGGSGLLNNTGIAIGGGTGGVSVGTSMHGGGRGTPEESEVVFAGGVVVRSDAKR